MSATIEFVRRRAGASRRDRPPARRFAGIEPRWSDGRWRWRARRVADNRVRVGPLRDEQEAASRDRATLDARAAAFRGTRGLTLHEALERVTEEARRRGVSERTLRGMFGPHCRYVARVIGSDVQLAELVDGDRIRGLVLASKRAGRAASTTWSKDCWLLSRAFRVAGLPDPIPEVRRTMRPNVKRVPAEIVYFATDELCELIARMRGGRVEAGYRAPQPATCEADADLVELLAMTGVRAGELGRVRVADLDVRRCRLRIREAKDRAHPRTVELPASSRPMLERLVAQARRAATAGERDPLLVPDAERAVSRRLARWQILVREPRLTARNLRHSFGTALIQVAGAAPTEAMAALGHRRIGTTGRYVSAVGTRARALAELLGEALGPPAAGGSEKSRTKPVTTTPHPSTGPSAPPEDKGLQMRPSSPEIRPADPIRSASRLPRCPRDAAARRSSLPPPSA